MRTRRAFGALCLGSLIIAPTVPSDPIGIYALVDRVVMEPDTITPQRIQIWGTFVFDGMVERRDGKIYSVEVGRYRPAQRGYLYYEVNNENARATLAEWNDLRSVAGTGEAVGFGPRGEPAGRVRRPSEAPGTPEIYPLNIGVVRNGLGSRSGAPPLYAVTRVPAALSPADGGRARAGTITLVARNVADTAARYLFEIEGPGDRRGQSEPLAAGGGETRWSPPFPLRAGETYTWRVRAVIGSQWRGAPDESTFGVER